MRPKLGVVAVELAGLGRDALHRVGPEAVPAVVAVQHAPDRGRLFRGGAAPCLAPHHLCQGYLGRLHRVDGLLVLKLQRDGFQRGYLRRKRRYRHRHGGAAGRQTAGAAGAYQRRSAEGAGAGGGGRAAAGHGPSPHPRRRRGAAGRVRHGRGCHRRRISRSHLGVAAQRRRCRHRQVGKRRIWHGAGRQRACGHHPLHGDAVGYHGGRFQKKLGTQRKFHHNVSGI